MFWKIEVIYDLFELGVESRIEKWKYEYLKRKSKNALMCF